jgi:hypothetical protein
MVVFLSLCGNRHLQQIRCRLDGCRSGDSELAKILLRATIRQQGADPKKLTIHADRGSSMFALLLPFTFLRSHRSVGQVEIHLGVGL